MHICLFYILRRIGDIPLGFFLFLYRKISPNRHTEKSGQAVKHSKPNTHLKHIEIAGYRLEPALYPIQGPA